MDGYRHGRRRRRRLRERVADMADEPDRPDAFKALMATAKAGGRPELAHQSLARPLTGAESALADALMEIYAAGASEAPEVAAALAKRAIAMPSSGRTEWTAESLELELRTLNADLDAAYDSNGFGA